MAENWNTKTANIFALKEFAKAVIEVSFDGGSLDGADIQELAVKYGLLKCVPFDPEKHEDPYGYGLKGENWFEYAGQLSNDIGPEEHEAP